MPARRNTATQADFDAVEPAVMAAFEADRKAFICGDDNDRDAVESFLSAARNILERRLGLPFTQVIDGLAQKPETDTARWWRIEDSIERAESVEELETLWSEVKTFTEPQTTKRMHLAINLIKAADKFVQRSGPVDSAGTAFKNQIGADLGIV